MLRHLFQGESSIVTENIFENRFMHVPELRRSREPNIEQKGKTLFIKGEAANLEGGAL